MAATSRKRSASPRNQVEMALPQKVGKFCSSCVVLIPNWLTYHQSLLAVKASAVTATVVAAASQRLRVTAIPRFVIRTAPIAPTTAIMPVKVPKWCVHLVGVRVRRRSDPMLMPATRVRTGVERPAMGLRRAMMNTMMPRIMSIMKMGKRRVTEPSGLMPKRAIQRALSSNQPRLGPISVRTRTASRIAPRVWSAKTV